MRNKQDELLNKLVFLGVMTLLGMALIVIILIIINL